MMTPDTSLRPAVWKSIATNPRQPSPWRGSPPALEDTTQKTFFEESPARASGLVSRATQAVGRTWNVGYTARGVVCSRVSILDALMPIQPRQPFTRRQPLLRRRGS